MAAPERWNDISRIFNDALRLAPVERAAYLQRACGGDTVLRRELASLLEHHAAAQPFIAPPAFDVMAGVLGGEPGGSSTPEQVRHLQQAFASALELPPAERLQFLERALLAADGGRRFTQQRGSHAAFDSSTPTRPVRLASEYVCGSCGTTCAGPDRFCRACGTPINLGGRMREERFRSGTLFANRFRIVALLGRGGMGEVYRAEDLQLGQPVALKFLTSAWPDGRARDRLRTEVRLARQIAHPNVCRVYDIGESQGDLYLSMEYVDGEDLAALLTRIGRVGFDKALDIAHKLAIGLAAAHARGVLHRDLKPRNIMIDSRGEVRIMDFGLATRVTDRPDDLGAGTPSYMAPEQLAGREPTRQSDIYALGLVLYEVFTGHRPADVSDARELLRVRESEPPLPPTTHVPDLEPAIERVILQCLEADPRMRPASALSVAAALPGGDPLAAALATGETPSPELLAAAGPVGALRPAAAISLLSSALLGLVLALVLTPSTQPVSMLPLRDPPEVLASRARDVLRTIGYATSATDMAFGFQREAGYLGYMKSSRPADQSPSAWWRRVLANPPSPISFWYRQGETVVPPVPFSTITGMAAPAYPAAGTSDVVAIDVGIDGRLLRFSAPVFSTQSLLPAPSVDWSVLFSAARLDMSRFVSVEPSRKAGPAESWVAWMGPYENDTGLSVRVEGAEAAGRVVNFEVVFPWSGASAAASAFTNASSVPVAFVVMTVLIHLALSLVALRNWRIGRGNIRGALLVGFYAFATLALLRLLSAPDLGDAILRRPLLINALGTGTYVAAIYLAIEPWVRRRLPHTLITWSRLLAGRWRDPLVGRDVLIGVAAGLMLVVIGRLTALVVIHYGGTPQDANSFLEAAGLGFVLENLSGMRLVLMVFILPLYRGMFEAPSVFFVIFLFRVIFRKPWLATAAFVIFGAVATILQTRAQATWDANIGAFAFLLNILVVLPLALRFGLVTVAALYCVGWYSNASLLTLDFTAWYGQSSLLTVVAVTALAVWATHVALGRPPLWRASTF